MRSIVLITLLVFFALTADTSISDKSQTFDEAAHITAGYSYWHTGNFQLNTQNGLFPQALAAIPLLFETINFPEYISNNPDPAYLWHISDQFFYHHDNDAQSMLKNSRRMIILLGILTGILVFLWSLKLWGDTGAYFSLILYCLSPSLLAHTRLATSDMAVTFAFLLSLYTFWMFIRSPSWKNILLTGISFGVLALSKMSSIIIIPTVIVTLIIVYIYQAANPYRSPESQKAYPPYHYALAITTAMLIALMVINVAYSADTGKTSLDFQLLDKLPTLFSLPIEWASNLYLLPDRFLNGLAFVLHRTEFRMSFAAGLYSTNGWWWYLPFTFLVKTPITALLAITLSFGFLITHLRNSRGKYDLQENVIGLILILTFVVIYLAFSAASQLSIGHRHLLPIYPLLFILCGIAARNIPRRIRPVIFLGLVASLSFETLNTHPHYLSFTNVAYGGTTNGYRQLVDSSHDWGQDLPALARWQQQNPQKPCSFSYFGTADPGYYKITCRKLPGFLDMHENDRVFRLEPGWIIISATMLQLGPISPQVMGPWSQQLEQQYIQLANGPNPANNRLLSLLQFGRLLHYLKKLGPDDQIAPSLLVYHINSDMLQDALSPSASYNK